MLKSNVPYDREAQSRAALFPAPSLVHPVESLEDSLYIPFGNTEPLIDHLDTTDPIVFRSDQSHWSRRITIFHGIVDEIHECLFYQNCVTSDHYA